MKKSERDARRIEAIETLRTLIPAGSTVYMTLSSVSRSGMSRMIIKFMEDQAIQFLGYDYDDTKKVDVNVLQQSVINYLLQKVAERKQKETQTQERARESYAKKEERQRSELEAKKAEARKRKQETAH